MGFVRFMDFMSLLGFMSPMDFMTPTDFAGFDGLGDRESRLDGIAYPTC